jgi:hypothetical protein
VFSIAFLNRFPHRRKKHAIIKITNVIKCLELKAVEDQRGEEALG